MSDGEDNFKTLDHLIRLFRDKAPSVQVGIFEDSARHTSDAGDTGEVSDLGNASIGAIHEFGTASIPQRSFLRMPLETHLESYLKKSDLNEETLKQALEEGTQEAFAEKIAQAAKACVDGAFDTAGFGSWAPHSPNTDSASGKILEETGQLKAAVSTQIVKS